MSPAKLLSTAALVFTAVISLAQDPPAPAPGVTRELPKYTDAEAGKHIGEEATVTGKVAATGTSKQGNIYLNFGEKFPKQTFSAVIFGKDAAKFSDFKQLEGKTVAVTGKIELYNDKPQIAVSSTVQMKVVEEPAAAPATPPAAQ